MTREQYESVRACRTRFVVLDGHQDETSERVVANGGRFLVVEKSEARVSGRATRSQPALTGVQIRSTRAPAANGSQLPSRDGGSR
jgi:hypothetical protein